MARIVILGAGFGGLTVAQRLAESSGRHRVTIVDRRSHFMMGLAKPWILVGRRSPTEGQRQLALLRAGAVRFVQAEVEAIDLDAREVRTAAGPLAFDYLVVALGADVMPGAVPGLPPEANLLAALDGHAAGQFFDGSGECFFELGGGHAMQMQGQFFRAIDERIVVSPPSAEALAAKERFESERLKRWFG
jgi:NADPH-dependent 2,4-dienoyl-CoA reductase/sulfur reductase-like enzyme